MRRALTLLFAAFVDIFVAVLHHTPDRSTATSPDDD